MLRMAWLVVLKKLNFYLASSEQQRFDDLNKD